MNDHIDPNKKITAISDCQGTCKTPIGCSCGKRVNPDLEDELWREERGMTAITKTAIATDGDTVVAESTVMVASGEAKSSCSKSDKRGRSAPCCKGTHKLEVYDWLEDMADIIAESKLVEVQFKNTRKGYYINSNDIELYKGDVVAVEASPGHDIGEVTLTGKLVELQMKKVNFRGDIRRVYRIAKQNDLEKYEQAKAREHKTMLRAREIAEELELDMKISDVEFQGDGNKAIFYYIADGRVDFRQLIKHYASEFRVKIEMKQIGARQEAGRVGGIGPCGRELCCSSSMSNFVSVSTSAARIQDIPLNPQKLAGQCGKLKCCLNFEVDTYVEAQRKLPARDIVLETKDNSYYHFKTDVLSGCIIYSTDKHFAANLVSLPSQKVFDVIRQNKRGERPLNLNDLSVVQPEEKKNYDVLEQESISRFDQKERANGDKDRSNRRRGRNSGRNNNYKDANNGEVVDQNKTNNEGNNNSRRDNNRPPRNRNNRNHRENREVRDNQQKDREQGQEQTPRNNNRRSGRNNNRRNNNSKGNQKSEE